MLSATFGGLASGSISSTSLPFIHAANDCGMRRDLTIATRGILGQQIEAVVVLIIDSPR